MARRLAVRSWVSAAAAAGSHRGSCGRCRRVSSPSRAGRPSRRADRVRSAAAGATTTRSPTPTGHLDGAASQGTHRCGRTRRVTPSLSTGQVERRESQRAVDKLNPRHGCHPVRRTHGQHREASGREVARALPRPHRQGDRPPLRAEGRCPAVARRGHHGSRQRRLRPPVPVTGHDRRVGLQVARYEDQPESDDPPRLREPAAGTRRPALGRRGARRRPPRRHHDLARGTVRAGPVGVTGRCSARRPLADAQTRGAIGPPGT